MQNKTYGYQPDGSLILCPEVAQQLGILMTWSGRRRLFYSTSNCFDVEINKFKEIAFEKQKLEWEEYT